MIRGTFVPTLYYSTDTYFGDERKFSFARAVKLESVRMTMVVASHGRKKNGLSVTCHSAPSNHRGTYLLSIKSADIMHRNGICGESMSALSRNLIRMIMRTSFLWEALGEWKTQIELE